MNSSISFYRISLLIKRFFIENKSSEMMYWIILILIFNFIHQADFVRFILLIAGIGFAGRQYNFSNSSNSQQYLLIPTTHLEKILTTFLLCSVYYFGLSLVAYMLGNLMGTQFYNMLWNTNDTVSWDLFTSNSEFHDGMNLLATSFSMLDYFWFLITIQSVFILGSILFKKNAFTKTIISVFAILFLFTQLEFAILNSLFDDTVKMNSNLSYVLERSSNTKYIFEIISKSIYYLLAPFLWIVSYYRLTEKEV